MPEDVSSPTSTATASLLLLLVLPILLSLLLLLEVLRGERRVMDACSYILLLLINIDVHHAPMSTATIIFIADSVDETISLPMLVATALC